MDYEKKYNHALEVVRELQKDWASTQNRAAREIELAFPELRESEDEKMLKKIIEYLEMIKMGCVICTIDTSEEIAWLEKQKENPKNADSISADCVSSAKCEDRSPKHTDSFGTDIRDTPAYWRGWDDAMKQKEQKPGGLD